MNRGEVHQISMKLGQLSAAVEMMTDMWKHQEENATAGRKALHEKFEHFRSEVGLQISGLSLRVDRLTDKVTMIEPSVTAFKDKMKDDREVELLSEGGRRFRVKVGAWIVAGASAVGWGLHELVNYLKH